MTVTLMVEREVVPGAQEEIKALLRELRSAATRRAGFISGQTVVDAFSPACFMTISVWASMAAWERWKNDLERAEIIRRIDPLVQGMSTSRLWRSDEDAPAAAV